MKNLALSQEYYNVNGAIYIPSKAYNIYQMWKNYDSVKTKRDISLAKKVNLNALRIWVSYEYWLEDSSSFIEKFEDLIKICSDAKIRLLVSLFERCGQEPNEDTLNDINPQTASAIKSPGTVITKNSDLWDKPISFVKFFMENYKNRNELLAIEVMNEPALGEDNLDFSVEMFKTAASMKGEIPLTMGSISFEYNLYFMEYGLDILQYHDNFPKSVEDFEYNLKKAQEVQNITGRPVWLTEWQRIRCGTQGWDGEPISEDELGPNLASIAPLVKKYKIGNFFWSLMLKPAYLPGQRKAGTFNGLFRDDGTAYSDEDAKAISAE